ncbi:MAG: hypothetical protein M1833_004129 [Piccolia ochrophora]|nr:MAG: hypothetical protein M1833_004129 [Piccolia ochrophora]
MEALRKAGRFFAPKSQKSEDGRDQWGSRTSFVLASMGGAVGLGNLLRYPGQVFNNNGLQWFIPYLIALFFLGIPVLMLEISIGQGYRGSCVIAYDHISKRTKGVGLGVVLTGFFVCVYYVPILCWVMNYFRNSFVSPLPWAARMEDFYMGDIVANPDPVPGSFSDSGSIEEYVGYPALGMVGETVGWCAFIYFVIWLCIFKGVGLLGRVVYFTMGLPVVTAIILTGRGVSLPNAGRGIKLYFGEWNGGQLASGDIWQAACGQIFFSIGVGFGYFTSYASYNPKYANTVQDALIIACCNSLYEILCGFAVFGVIGYLGLSPDADTTLSTFTIAFLTYPQALAEMPGANFWAVLFFFTLMLLGVSSAFALLESIITLVKDTDWGKKIPRTAVVTATVVVSFLLSLIYCTEFGYYLLDATDTWVNYLALFFIVWCECVACTTIYRSHDVIGQVGWPAYLAYNIGYLGGMVFGNAVGHSVSPPAGAGVGFGFFVAGTVVAVLIGKTPDSDTPGFWGRSVPLRRFWWVAFYSGNQLRHDLNVTVAAGNAWALPFYWPPVLRYISAPILSIVFCFAYPSFYAVRNDPLQIFSFSAAHVTMFLVVAGLVLPRWFDVFVPVARRGEGDMGYAPNVTLGDAGLPVARSLESGSDENANKVEEIDSTK